MKTLWEIHQEGQWVSSRSNRKSAKLGYLADVLDRIVSDRTKVNALHELLPRELFVAPTLRGFA